MFALDELTVGTNVDVRPLTAVSGAGYQAQKGVLLPIPAAQLSPTS